MNDPDDKGGETICGIARNYHPTEKLWAIVDANKTKIKDFGNKKSKEETRKDWKTLADLCYKDENFLNLVKDFVYRKYYLKYKIDKLNSKAKQSFVIDFCYNSGYAIRELQKMLGLTPDNIIGDKTVKEINKLDDNTFIKKACETREAYYLKQIEKNPIKNKYKNGWLARVQYYRDTYA